MNETLQKNRSIKQDLKLALLGFFISVVPEIVLVYIIYNTSGAPDYFGSYSIFKIGLLYFLAPIVEGWTIAYPICLTIYLLLLVAPLAAFLLWRSPFPGTRQRKALYLPLR